MSLYEQQLAAGRIMARLPWFKRLVAETEGEILDFIGKHRPAMLSLSWGKQSTVLAHMIHRLDSQVLCRFFRVENSDLVANFSEVRDEFLRRFPIRYEEQVGYDDLKQAAAEHRRAAGIQGTIVGLAAEESKARRITTGKGWLRWADGTWRCTPLRRWTWRDIAAYHAVHDLPCLNTYHRHGFEARTAARVIVGRRTERGFDFMTPSQQRRFLDSQREPKHPTK